MVSAELAPIAKVGGLADAVAGLAAAMTARGHDVKVVLPLYGHLDREGLGLRPAAVPGRVPLRVDQDPVTVRFWSPGRPVDAPEVLLVECERIFGQPSIYTDPAGTTFVDSAGRASLLAQATLVVPELLGWPADVIHAHDALASLAPIYRRRWYGGRDLPGRAGTLLTIHNLAHQEIHPAGWVQRVGLPAELVAYPGPLEFYGQLNLLKGGILDADLVNTVSPRYAREATSHAGYGCGLDGVLASRGADFVGILNGCDTRTWNPATDPYLPARYDAADLVGKRACRERLQRSMGLNGAPGPLLGMVTRLVEQKGLDLVVPLVDRLVAAGFALVVLGTGEPRYHDALAAAAARHRGRVAFLPEFSEARAHLVYAGSDAFLMPSQFEPCGLGQMYALRYGTPPVVRRTGGLADTVADAGDPQGTGFVFDAYDPQELWLALERVRQAREAGEPWSALVARAMAQDFSWDAAASRYEELYVRLAAG